jgi:hypothetical protein
LRSSAFQSQAVYVYEYRRMELIGRILRRRFPAMSEERARAFRLTDGTWASIGRLLAAHARYRVTGSTTGDAEIRLAQGFVVTRALARVVHFARRRLIRRIRRGQAAQHLASA